MKAVITPTNLFPLEMDGALFPTLEPLEDYIRQMSENDNIDASSYSIENPVCRARLEKGGFVYHILEKPAGLTKLYYSKKNGENAKQIPFVLPNIVMILQMKYLHGELRVIGDRLFVTKEPINKELSNTLYRWPLSNVYGGNYICWGNNREMSKIDENTSFIYLDEFLLSYKNDDLLLNNNYQMDTLNPDTTYSIDCTKLNKVSSSILEIIAEM